MGKATNETIKTRVAALKGLILSGSSNSTCVVHAAQAWGLSRRQSYRLLKQAWSEVHQDVEAVGVDRHELISWAIHHLMAAAGQAKQQKNPGAVVACINQLDWMCGLGINSTSGHRVHRTRL